MLKSEQRLQNAYLICVVAYIFTLLFGLLTTFMNKDMSGFGMGILAIFTPMIIPAIFKLFKLKPVYEIYLINIIFIYFASLVGSTYHWYRIVGFDKVLHFSSGLFLTIGSIIVYFAIRKTLEFKQRSDYHIFLIFINAFNLSLAALWEFYEYAMLIFFNNDAINHYTQGVHDSMTDMILAFIAGLLITLIVHRGIKQQKSNFVIDLYQKYFSRNLKKSD